ncbi:hypothetical protein BJX64DRAFT_285773 [Aspergillus heterothallicus]
MSSPTDPTTLTAENLPMGDLTIQDRTPEDTDKEGTDGEEPYYAPAMAKVLYTGRRNRLSVSMAIALQMTYSHYRVCLEKQNFGQQMLSDPVKLGDRKWDEKLVHGTEILEYLIRKYDPTYRLSYLDESYNASRVRIRVAAALEEHKKQEVTAEFLWEMEGLLQVSVGDYLVGNKMTLADMLYFPLIFSSRYAVEVVDSGAFPCIYEWYMRMAKLISVQNAVEHCGWSWRGPAFSELLRMIYYDHVGRQGQEDE